MFVFLNLGDLIIGRREHKWTALAMMAAAATSMRRRRLVLAQFASLIIHSLGGGRRRLVGAAEIVQHGRRFHDPFAFPVAQTGHARIDEFQKEVDVADDDADQVHGNRLAEQGAKGEHDPRQVGGVEGQDAQKGHFGFGIAPTPHVGHHEGERVAEKVNVGMVRGKGGNADNAEQEHPNVIGNPVAKIAFFQQSTVLDLQKRQ
jgi:hypothetical protein